MCGAERVALGHGRQVVRERDRAAGRGDLREAGVEHVHRRVAEVGHELRAGRRPEGLLTLARVVEAGIDALDVRAELRQREGGPLDRGGDLGVDA